MTYQPHDIPGGGKASGASGRAEPRVGKEKKR
jgi:hypothetical protein